MCHEISSSLGEGGREGDINGARMLSVGSWVGPALTCDGIFDSLYA